MTEDRLQQIERELASADAAGAAAIAFAAIYRMGEIGALATAAFARLSEGSLGDPDLVAFADGWRAIASVMALETAP